MKIIKHIICILLCTLLIGCSTFGKGSKSNSLDYEVPNDFGFVLKYGVGAKNVINTFDGTFEKDLVTAGTVKANLNFTTEELKHIYNKMQLINISDYPSNYVPLYSDNPEPGTIKMVMPHMTYNFHFIIDGESKEINWEDTSGSEAAKAKELRSLFNYIEEIISSKEEFKKLPEAVGGYE